MPLRHHLLEGLGEHPLRGPHLGHPAHHGEHEAQVAVGGGPHRRAQLGVEDVGVAQAVAHRPEAQRGVLRVVLLAGGELVPAQVEGADRHRAPVHGLEDGAVVAVVVLLGGELVAPHEEELGAVEPDSLAAVGEEPGDLLAELDVADHPEPDAVHGLGREVLQAGQLGLALHLPDAGRLVVGALPGGGVHHHHAAAAVDDDPVAPLRHRGGPAGADHGRDLQRAGHDGGVAGDAARVGDQPGHLAVVEEQRGVGRREVAGHHDGAGRRGLGDVHALAEQVLHDPLAHVLDVGAALAEELVVRVEGALDLADGPLHRPLDVDPLLAHQPPRLVDERGVAQHGAVHLEDGEVLGPVGGLHLGLHPVELVHRELDGRLEPAELRLHLLGRDLAPRGADPAAVDRPAPPHRDAG